MADAILILKNLKNQDELSKLKKEKMSIDIKPISL